MGDHRASIKIEMEFHGIKKSTDMWINYMPDGEYIGVDDRVIQFIREIYELGMEKYNERDRRRIKEQERLAEIELFNKLKEKYEPRIQGGEF